MKYIILLFPLLLAGCGCQSEYTATITQIHSCDKARFRGPTPMCLVTVSDGSKRKIDSVLGISVGKKITLCND